MADAADDDQPGPAARRLQPAVDRVWAAALTLILLILCSTSSAASSRASARSASEPAVTESEADTMAKRIDVKDLNVYYGDVQGRRGRHDDRRAALGDRVHRPVRLRQVDLPAHPQPDARGDPRRPRRGQGACSTTRTSTPPASTRSAVRRTVGMVFQRPNPFPTMSIYDNVAAGLRLNGVKNKKTLDEVGRAVAARAPTSGTRSRTGWTSPAPACPAGSSSGCASPARSPSSRRCC